MDGFRKPAPLVFQGNVSENWRRFQLEFDIYVECIGTLTDRQQAMVLLNLAGPEAAERERSFTYAPAVPAGDGQAAVPAESRYDVTVLKRKFTELCTPKKNVILERHYFNSRSQLSGESFGTFLSDLRIKASSCEFGDLHDELIRDRIVTGVQSDVIRKQLLQQSELRLDRAVEICRVHEVTESRVGELQHPAAAAATAVHSVKATAKKKFYRPSNRETTKQSSENKNSGEHKNSEIKKCKNCGRKHGKNFKCPAADKRCFSCNKTGHYKEFCPESVHSVELGYNVFFGQCSRNRPYVFPTVVNGTKFEMEVDTGSALTLMSEKSYVQWKERPPLKKDSLPLMKTYTGEPVRVLGTFEAEVQWSTSGQAKQEKSLPVHVVAGEGPFLMGRNWLREMQLDWYEIRLISSSSLDEVLQGHSDVFKEELGELRGTTARIIVDPEAEPKFLKHRSIPYVMREKLDHELDRLMEMGVISSVDFSDWAAPVVVADKPGGAIRVCGDFRLTVNPVVREDRYPVPRIEDLYAQLSGGKKFTKLDLSNAYLQLVVDEESKKFLTINTHRGLYQYNRLPFGVSSAPAIFQRVMDTLLKGIPNCMAYLDDILVTGKTEQDHLNTLNRVLDVLSKAGLRLRKSKCTFMADDVAYLGFRVDSKGLSVLPEKTRAVLDAPTPRNREELQSFLGMVNFYGRFIPNCSSLLAPLYSLLRADQKWRWTAKETKVVSVVKEKICKAPVLMHFDVRKPIVLSCDASPYGLGVVLAHSVGGFEHPVAFASRVLSSAEKNYSQIEREALSIVYGVQKFYQYLYGQRFVITTDHKPLLGIMGESRGVPQMVSPRLRKWSLILSTYNYSLEYRPGKDNAHADGLSRLPLPGVPHNTPQPVEFVNLLTTLDEMPLTLKDIRKMTDKDPVLSLVRSYTQYGWPDAVSEDLRPYHVRRLELSVMNNCVMWGDRIIIPQGGRKRFLEILHSTHSGTSRMKSRARGLAWWPNMDSQIEVCARQCSVCEEHSRIPAVPMHPWSFPDGPWERLHVDFMGPFMGSMCLVIVDAYSKWIDVYPMNSIDAPTTIRKLRNCFATHGLPLSIVSDNGPTFTSQEFRCWLEHNGIRHVRSAPYHPASNGLAERAVQTVKNGVRKQMQGDLQTRLDRFLFVYRNTPHSITEVAPSELLRSAAPRTHLDLIRPQLKERVLVKQEVQKDRYDGRKAPRDYSPGTEVYARKQGHLSPWVPATVTHQRGQQLEAVMADGVPIRRHMDHVKPRQATTPQKIVSPRVVTPRKASSPESVCESSRKASSPESVSESSCDVPSEAIVADVPSEVPLRRSSRARKPVDKLTL